MARRGILLTVQELGKSAIGGDEALRLPFYVNAIDFNLAPTGRQRLWILSPIVFGNSQTGKPEHCCLQQRAKIRKEATIILGRRLPDHAEGLEPNIFPGLVKQSESAALFSNEGGGRSFRCFTKPMENSRCPDLEAAIQKGPGFDVPETVAVIIGKL